jgi:cysteinyl-tRNA synthetase
MVAELDGVNDGLDDAMSILLLLRAKAKAEKNWALSDQIRDELKEKGFEIKDGKEGTTWNKF